MSELEPVQKNIMLPIVSLYPHDRNYRAHPPEQIKMLKASLERFNGQVRSIVVQECANGSYTIVAGHGVVQAAQELINTNPTHYAHLQKLRCDIISSSWPVDEVNAYLIADNNLSQHASDDDALLATLLQEQADAGYDLASLGSDEETLRQMLEALGDEYAGGGSQDDEEDEFDEEIDDEQTRVQVGDVWRLGRHVIACVNSCDEQAVKKLVGNKKISMIFADPPYGVKERTMRKSAGRGRLAECNDFPPVIGDDKPFDPAFLLSIPSKVRIMWGANYYAHRLPVTSSWIVWDKRDGIPSNDNADCELAWTDAGGPARLFTHRWNGAIKASEQGERRVHPTQKPVKLAEFCFERFGDENDVIYDPFLGSGISVIAAEKMNDGRSVVGCELSADYINVILTRWETLTGQEATLLERVEEAAHA